MSDERPWGIMNPNSQHQRWSRWVFGIRASMRRRPSRKEVIENFRKYVAKRFGKVGQGKLDVLNNHYRLELRIEGPPAHDPALVAWIKQDFAEQFVAKGFGPSARLEYFNVALLAGTREDGMPADQLIVLPQLRLPDELFDHDRKVPRFPVLRQKGV